MQRSKLTSFLNLLLQVARKEGSQAGVACEHVWDTCSDRPRKKVENGFNLSLLSVALTSCLASASVMAWEPRITGMGEMGYHESIWGDGLYPFQDVSNQVIFFDFQAEANRFFSADNFSGIVSPGLGLRHAFTNDNVVGGYLFSDFMITDESQNYWFLSPGMDYYHGPWSVVVNGYFPVDNGPRQIGSPVVASDVGIDNYETLTGHTQYDHLIYTYYNMRWGMDWTGGVLLGHRREWGMKLGAYLYDTENLDAIAGGKGELDYYIKDNVVLKLEERYDNEFHNQTMAGVEITFFGKENRGTAETQLKAPIYRNLNINTTNEGTAIGKYQEVTEQSYLIRNDITYVSNEPSLDNAKLTKSTTITGKGTYENPYTGLDQNIINSTGKNKEIWVEGTGSNHPYNDATTLSLKSGQFIEGRTDGFKLAASSTSAQPIFDFAPNSGKAALYINNSNTLQNFIMYGNGASSSVGIDVKNDKSDNTATIKGVTVGSATTDVKGTIVGSTTTDTAFATALYNHGSKLSINQSKLYASQDTVTMSGTDEAQGVFGIYNDDGTITVKNSTVSASANQVIYPVDFTNTVTAGTWGIYNLKGTATVQDTSIKSTITTAQNEYTGSLVTSAISAIGIFNEAGSTTMSGSSSSVTATVSNVTDAGSDNTFSVGFYNLDKDVGSAALSVTGATVNVTDAGAGIAAGALNYASTDKAAITFSGTTMNVTADTGTAYGISAQGSQSTVNVNAKSKLSATRNTVTMSGTDEAQGVFGIYNDDGTISVNNSTVSASANQVIYPADFTNTVTAGTWGIYNLKGTATVQDTSIKSTITTAQNEYTGSLVTSAISAIGIFNEAGSTTMNGTSSSVTATVSNVTDAGSDNTFAVGFYNLDKDVGSAALSVTGATVNVTDAGAGIAAGALNYASTDKAAITFSGTTMNVTADTGTAYGISAQGNQSTVNVNAKSKLSATRNTVTMSGTAENQGVFGIYNEEGTISVNNSTVSASANQVIYPSTFTGTVTAGTWGIYNLKGTATVQDTSIKSTITTAQNEYTGSLATSSISAIGIFNEAGSTTLNGSSSSVAATVSNVSDLGTDSTFAVGFYNFDNGAGSTTLSATDTTVTVTDVGAGKAAGALNAGLSDKATETLSGVTMDVTTDTGTAYGILAQGSHSTVNVIDGSNLTVKADEIQGTTGLRNVQGIYGVYNASGALNMTDSSVTVEAASISYDAGSSSTGGALVGAFGIYNAGTANLTSSSVTINAAVVDYFNETSNPSSPSTDPGDSVGAFGIYNTGSTATLTNSVVQSTASSVIDNQTPKGDAPPSSIGAFGVYNTAAGTMTVTGSSSKITATANNVDNLGYAGQALLDYVGAFGAYNNGVSGSDTSPSSLDIQQAQVIASATTVTNSEFSANNPTVSAIGVWNSGDGGTANTTVQDASVTANATWNVNSPSVTGSPVYALGVYNEAGLNVSQGTGYLTVDASTVTATGNGDDGTSAGEITGVRNGGLHVTGATAVTTVSGESHITASGIGSSVNVYGFVNDANDGSTTDPITGDTTTIMDGSTIDSEGGTTGASIAVYNTTGGVIDINGVTLMANNNQGSGDVDGVSIYNGGTVTITDAVIQVGQTAANGNQYGIYTTTPGTTTTVALSNSTVTVGTSSSAQNAYGVYNNSSGSTTAISGSNFTVTSDSGNTYGIENEANVFSGGTVNVSANSTFNVTSQSGASYGIQNEITDSSATVAGTVNVADSTFAVTSQTGTSYGIQNQNGVTFSGTVPVGTVNVSGNSTFTATSSGGNAYGVDNSGSGSKVTISDSTFNVTTSGAGATAYGLWDEGSGTTGINIDGTASDTTVNLNYTGGANGYTYQTSGNYSPTNLTGVTFVCNSGSSTCAPG